MEFQGSPKSNLTSIFREDGTHRISKYSGQNVTVIQSHLLASTGLPKTFLSDDETQKNIQDTGSLKAQELARIGAPEPPTFMTRGTNDSPHERFRQIETQTLALSTYVLSNLTGELRSTLG